MSCAGQTRAPWLQQVLSSARVVPGSVAAEAGASTTHGSLPAAVPAREELELELEAKRRENDALKGATSAAHAPSRSLDLDGLEAELLQLRSENRDLRLKAGANMTKDDDELIFEEYLLRLGQVQIALALDPPKSSHPHELRLAIDRSSRCATPAGRSRKCSKLTTKPSSSSPTKG